MKRYIMTIIIILFSTIILIAFSRYYLLRERNSENSAGEINPLTIRMQQIPLDEIKKNSTPFNVPLDNSLSRITKKPFGIYVTPKNSPISPERFSGFHTGADFETTSAQANTPVEVRAIADGKITNKLIVSGYGGVILEKAIIDNQPVTILYGHVDIRAQNSRVKIGETIKKGESIALLSPGYSSQSGFERKHLHLAIIKGDKIDYRGYVQTQNELFPWIDPQSILGR
jgi:murein DD-endopeptidase MepM/ murein hydrolase activator NlpD